jgi:hypothetical protein
MSDNQSSQGHPEPHPKTEEERASTCLVELTLLQKRSGLLSKVIRLVDGKVWSNGSACQMAHGAARRITFDNGQAFADFITGMPRNQALVLGQLKDGIPDYVEIVTDAELKHGAPPGAIARTKEYFGYEKDKPTFVLLDIDLKEMPEHVAKRVAERGGVWNALCEACPALKPVARIERPSTSSRLRNTKSGEEYPDSGLHIFIRVRDGSDIPRFLAALHERLWLAGWGWGIVSAAGAFLERSLIDKSVGSPERPVFEGPAEVITPLEQGARIAIAYDGEDLDTQSVHSLTDAEALESGRLKAAEEVRLLPERTAARAKWIEARVEDLKKKGVPEPEARAQATHWADSRDLTGDFPLPFDDPAIAGTTVAQVLAAPGKYLGKHLSDPHEGPGYGRGKAILYQRRDGTLWINSFAHGGIKYELKTTEAAERDAEIERLAKMPFLDYEQTRKEAAKRLRMRVEVLHKAVEQARAELARKARATPEAIEAERKRIEAAEAAARAAHEAERARLWDSCRTLAENPNLLTVIKEACHKLGVVGESSAVCAIYLSAVSRLAMQTISLLREGAPSSGKNYPFEKCLELFPAEAVIRLSSGSPLSLIYAEGGDDAYKHKIVYIAEASFLARRKNGDEPVFTYLVRTLISERRLHHLVTVTRANGPPQSRLIIRNGPVTIWLTSARPIEEELKTRLAVLDADETQEQLEAVVTRDRTIKPPDEAELERLRDLQRWLLLDAPYCVAIPFDRAIAHALLAGLKELRVTPPQRLKRDITNIFAAIEASAILHKAQRKRDSEGRIVATLDDYDHARDAYDVGLASLYGLKTPETLLAVVVAAETLGATPRNTTGHTSEDSFEEGRAAEAAARKGVKISIRDLMKAAGLSSRATASNRLYDAVERGYLIIDPPAHEKAVRTFWLGVTSAELKERIHSRKEGHVFPAREKVDSYIPPEQVGPLGQGADEEEINNLINSLESDPLSQPHLGQTGTTGTDNPASRPLSQSVPNGIGTANQLKTKQFEASVPAVSPVLGGISLEVAHNPDAALSSAAEDIINAARAAGMSFILNGMEDDFTIEQSQAGDQSLIAAIQANRAAITDWLAHFSEEGEEKVASPPLSAALTALEHRCPDHIEAADWRRAVRDGRRFLTRWGEQATALGWTEADVFGLPPVPEDPRPAWRRLARVDQLGLVWTLHGKPVSSITAERATIATSGWPTDVPPTRSEPPASKTTPVETGKDLTDPAAIAGAAAAAGMFLFLDDEGLAFRIVRGRGRGDEALERALVEHRDAVALFLRRRELGFRETRAATEPPESLSPRAVEEIARQVSEVRLYSPAQMEDAIRTRLAGVPPHALDVEVAKVMARVAVKGAPGDDEGERQRPSSVRDADGNIVGLAPVLAAWRDAIGIGKAVGIDSLTDGDLPEELQRALLAVAAHDGDRTVVSNVKLGRWLRDVNEVAVDGLLLRHVGSDRGDQLWALQTATPEIAAEREIAAAPSTADATVSADVPAASVNVQSASAPPGQTGAMDSAPTAVTVSAQGPAGTPGISNAAAAPGVPSASAQPAPAAATPSAASAPLHQAPNAQAPNVVAIPFMVTHEMRRQLIRLGYTPAAISRLTPQEAHDIINAKRYARGNR